MSRASVEQRLLARSRRDGACLLWVGHTTPAGYGSMKLNGASTGAHRVAFEAWNGPIPTGLEVDHLCGIRACIEPSHLEAVTHRENLRRSANWAATQMNKEECSRGHALAPSPPEGGRRPCRECGRRKVPCPSCGRPVPYKKKAQHLKSCGGAS